jgi:hypothetical protein
MTTPADWLFLLGSILFAIKPTIDMVRSLHLRRLPAPGSSSETPQARGNPDVLGAAPRRTHSLRRSHAS